MGTLYAVVVILLLPAFFYLALVTAMELYSARLILEVTIGRQLRRITITTRGSLYLARAIIARLVVLVISENLFAPSRGAGNDKQSKHI